MLFLDNGLLTKFYSIPKNYHYVSQCNNYIVFETKRYKNTSYCNTLETLEHHNITKYKIFFLQKVFLFLFNKNILAINRSIEYVRHFLVFFIVRLCTV